MKRLLPSFTLAVFLLTIPMVVKAQSARFDNFPDAKPTAGEVAPDFTLMTLEGETFNLHEVALDKPIVLEFGSFT
jgi:cytochrome oxidase Cu insertion factor (SCO1/SenC/PrrC family)